MARKRDPSAETAAAQAPQPDTAPQTAAPAQQPQQPTPREEDELSLLEQTIDQLTAPSPASSVLSSVLRGLAMRIAQRMGVPPDAMEKAVNDIAAALSEDPEIKKYLAALRITRALGTKGPLAERVSDIVYARLVNKLARKIEGGLDGGDEVAFLESIKRDAFKLAYAAMMFRAVTDMFRGLDLGGGSNGNMDMVKAIQEAVTTAVSSVTQSFGETMKRLADVMDKLNERLNALEEKMRKLEEEKRQTEFEKIVEMIRKEVDSRYDEIRRTVDELAKKLASGGGGGGGYAITIDNLHELIEKLKQLGFVVETPAEKLRKIEEKLSGEVPEEKKRILEELEKLAAKYRTVDKDVEIKRLEVELEKARGKSRFLETLGKEIGSAIRELLSNPAKIRDLVELISAGAPRTRQPAPGPDLSAEIPSIDQFIGGGALGLGVKGGAASAPATGGAAAPVREAGSAGSGSGSEKNVEVQRPEVHSGGAEHAGEQGQRDSGGDQGGDQAGVQG